MDTTINTPQRFQTDKYLISFILPADSDAEYHVSWVSINYTSGKALFAGLCI